MKGHFWESSYFATQIQDATHLLVALAYDHLNPVVENMVARPEEYTRSSAGWWAGEASGEIELLSHPLPFGLDPHRFCEALLAVQADKIGMRIARDLHRGNLDLASPKKRAALREELIHATIWPFADLRPSAAHPVDGSP